MCPLFLSLGGFSYEIEKISLHSSKFKKLLEGGQQEVSRTSYVTGGTLCPMKMSATYSKVIKDFKTATVGH